MKNRVPILLPLLLLGSLAGGCVRSKAMITSDPPGADVTMNGVSLGKTPVDHPFTWYWYYDFEATKDGYQPVTSRERFKAPIYLWPGPDLLMEMLPFYVTDTKHVHLNLEKMEERPEPIVVGSADETTAGNGKNTRE